MGAYARLLSEQIFSVDLDLLVSWRALETVLAEGGELGIHVHKVPRPRSVPVALLEWRGREINLITGSDGLPPPAAPSRDIHGAVDRIAKLRNAGR